MTHKNFAVSLAKKAGGVIARNFVLGMRRQIKKDGSPVTKTDLAINSMVIKAVKEHFPLHAVIGEEENFAVKDSEYAWVCDPVDGTIPFSHGMPVCMFSLALVFKGVPVLGVAYDPFINRMFFGEKGKGAFLNGKRIHVSKHKKLKAAYVCYEIFRTTTYPMPELANDLIFNKKSEFFPMGSIVYNGMLLAAGELDGIVFGYYPAHDVAAIKIIVEEAGGKVTDLWGKEQRYDRPVKGALISNGIIHKELLKIVQKHLKK